MGTNDVSHVKTAEASQRGKVDGDIYPPPNAFNTPRVPSSSPAKEAQSLFSLSPVKKPEQNRAKPDHRPEVRWLVNSSGDGI